MIFDTFSRSWDITKQTFGVIKADKEILLFPMLSSMFSIIFFILMAVPFVASNIISTVLPEDVGALIYWGVFFLFYLGVSFIATFFNVGVVYCAKKRFEGKDPTFSEGIKAAFSRIHLIFVWSIVSATVGVLIRMIENSARKSKGIGKLFFSLIAGALGLAWSIATLFVVPAMVVENLGPVDAIKRSVETLKKTWGESIVRYYGLGAAQTAFVLLGLGLFVLPAALIAFGFQSWRVPLLLVLLFVLYFMLVSLVFSTANTVFNTALYLYAAKGEVPSAYGKETMDNAFRRK